MAGKVMVGLALSWSSVTDSPMASVVLTVRYDKHTSSALPFNTCKGKGKVHVLAIALLTCFFKTRSALQSWKWQLIGMS